MRKIVLITLGAAALAVAGCDEMKAGFEKGYAEGKAKAEAGRAGNDEKAAAPAAEAGAAETADAAGTNGTPADANAADPAVPAN